MTGIAPTSGQFLPYCPAAAVFSSRGGQGRRDRAEPRRMALVCPVGHPPGVGTSFCRLCGRTYVEVSEVVETLVPVQEPPVEAHAVVSPAPAAPAKGMSHHVPVATPSVATPLVATPSVSPPLAPAPVVPKAPEVVAVPSPVAIQVTMPLVTMDTSDKPSPTATTPVDLGGHDPEPAKPSKVRRELDRAALLAGAMGGFVGGAVSGAVVTYVLS